MTRDRVRRVAQLGFILLAAVGCVDEDVPTLEAESSALDTRASGDAVLANVARNGLVTSSNFTGNGDVFINDGQRGTPGSAYWMSSTLSTVYNCNYGNWWVRVDFKPRAGETCPAGGCVRSITEVDLFSVQDNISGADPTPSTVTSLRGNVDFHLSYCPENVTCGSSLGNGWVDVPGGYITANNKAWRSVSFTPIRAKAVRATLDCAQSTRAYVAELEAWEPQTAPSCSMATPPDIGDGPVHIDDDDSRAAIIADSDRFWWNNIRPHNEEAGIDQAFEIKPDCVGNDTVPCCPAGLHGSCPDWWWIGARAEALVHMYDLLAPVDFERAKIYLDRLRILSKTLLKYRDDKRTVAPPGVPLSSGKPVDYFHNRVMPAWGSVGLELDGRWTTQVGLAGLFTYPMAAFARRVADHPDWFCAEPGGVNYRQDAIDLTLAVIDTYMAFRPDMHLTTSDPFGYYIHPTAYAGLQCNMSDSELHRQCDLQQRAAGAGIPWNLSFSFLKAMGEVAGAADSEMFRSTWGGAFAWYATEEAPVLIAKNINYWTNNTYAVDFNGTPGIYWLRHPPDYVAQMGFSSWPEDTGHGQFTLGSIVSIWENRGVIDALLARINSPVRMGLPTRYFTGIATNFLRRIWRSNNLLGHEIDGSGPTPTVTDNSNQGCNGFIPLAPFDKWVWIRCRDTILNPAVYYPPNWPAPVPGVFPALTQNNHAALLHYRSFRFIDPTDDLVWGGPGWAIWTTVNGGYLAGTSAAVSSDWSIAAAGDFNGDGSSDILWRNTDGRVQIYLMRNGEYLRTISLGSLAPAWAIKGAGDINGDGIADIVLYHAGSREAVAWLIGRSTNVIGTGSLGIAAFNWNISGIGDFNHDGKADLFWTLRNPAPTATQTAIWLLDGAKTIGYMNLSTPTISYDYSFEGIGRLNDQYKDDIVWRNASGSVLVWRSTSISGSTVNVSPVSPGSPGTEWDLQAVADINGDAISDFVWVRASDRRVEGWLLNASGGLNVSTLLGYTDPGWTIRASGPFD